MTTSQSLLMLMDESHELIMGDVNVIATNGKQLSAIENFFTRT